MMFVVEKDTIFAPATIPGTGAVAMIRVSGPEAIDVADNIISLSGSKLSDTEGYRIRYGTVREDDGNILDNVLVSVFHAPHSYTGEDSVEISCHASSYIVSGILQKLAAAGARAAGPGEFTQRAFLNGKMDLAQAEAVADVIAAQSKAAHRVAMNQLKGGYSLELKSLRDELLKMTSLLELELDFSEEDVEFASREELQKLVDEAIAHIDKLVSSFKVGNAVKNGVPVAIVGAVNAGKSTLLNALVGEDRAIVSEVEGTTRDTVEETFNIGGVLLRFIDTAGIRKTEEIVERIGIERSMRKMSEASIVLGVVDCSRDEDEVTKDIRFLAENVDMKEQRVVLVMNKCDIGNGLTGSEGSTVCDLPGNNIVNLRNNIVLLFDNKLDTNNIMAISAKTGYGLSTLVNRLSELATSLMGTTDSTLVTNIRHYEALSNASTALSRVRLGLSPSIDPVDSLSSSLPPDLIAQDLREALHHLGSILGDITTDEILGNIFRNFCIGK